MAPIGLKDKKIEDLTKQLVKRFVTAEPARKNVTVALQFALSNFRYHKYLDVDSNKVERTIKGLSEKFSIHGQGEKAKTFEKLCEKFLSCGLFDERLPEKSDEHYSILKSLLILSDSPVNTSYKEQLTSEPETVNDDFNWTKYLLDGEEKYIMRYQYHDTFEEEWTDSEEDEYSDDTDDELVEGKNKKMDQCFADSRARGIENSMITEIRDVLAKNLVEPYWLNDERYFDSVEHSEMTLASQWASYMQQCHPLGTVERTQQLHEMKLVRETIWMLSGVKHLHVYRFINDKFEVADTIETSHITKVSLQKFLQSFADLASLIVEIRDFITSVSKQQMLTKVPQTFQAFGFAVLSYIQEFNGYLSTIEDLIIKKEEAVTLAMLYHRLSRFQKEISEIYYIFSYGIKQVTEKENYEKVTSFLDVFYQSIVLADGMGEYGKWKVNVLLPIFLNSLQPYMEFLDSCLTEGKLFDESNEFCIERLPDIVNQTPEIWTSALSIKGCKEESKSCPLFFQPVLQEILLAGKSIILLESLGQLAKNADLRLQEDSLFQMFTNSVSCRSGTTNMSELFRVCFYPHINAKYKKSCSFLIQLLKTEYTLLDHLAAMRNFFLLEAGGAMYHFYSDIFRKSSRRERWQDMSYLNSLFQEALLPTYRTSQERITVGYSKPSKLYSDSFEGLELNYKAPWPVDLVIDEVSQKKYNSVFLFLLHVKRAKWSLDCLRFRDLENKIAFPELDKENGASSSITKQRIDHNTKHRMQLLRFDLMQFVNSLHQYIMTRILNNKLDFNEALSKAADLDEIIKAHNLYIEKVLECCLMTSKVEVMRGGILKVLKLAVKFNKLWTFNIRQNRDDIVTSIMEDLKKWRTFIVTFLTKQIKQGSHSDLEVLAFSLGCQKTLTARES